MLGAADAVQDYWKKLEPGTELRVRLLMVRRRLDADKSYAVTEVKNDLRKLVGSASKFELSKDLKAKNQRRIASLTSRIKLIAFTDEMILKSTKWLAARRGSQGTRRAM